MRKPRPDAKLLNLPDALQEELYQFLRRTTLEKAAAWLEDTHQIETSTGALSKFFSWYPRQAWIKSSVTFADQLAAQISKLPELQGKAAEVTAIAQAAFELQAAQDRDPKLHLALAKARTKTAELALKREHQEFLVRQYEEKIARARLALEKAQSKGGLSAETRELIEQQLKLL
jgi:predicted house-cleaning noncanonical NTP pyrophosphatase (MazG superfamily)